MLVEQLPRVLGFVIYREYQDGASVEELAEALHLPSNWIEERIEAVRMCLERQVRVELRPMPRQRRNARAAGMLGTASLSTQSKRTRRSL